jgi:23S rRNA pseudouridine2604 synthase
MEPTRINKYLAEKGFSTRRGADALIAAGKVKINGRPAKLGDKVNESDKVEVDQKAITQKEQGYVYYAYNKSIGIVTHSPQKGEKDIAQVVKLKGVFPLGRLDKESHGLILLTNDGRVTERLLSPEAEHEKEYVVKVDKPLKQNTLTRLGKGVKIEGYITKQAVVEELGTRALRLTITEGKRHQIRRMLTALGYVVTDLKRIRIMNIRLGELHDGEVRPLTATEKKTFLTDLGL